VVAVCCELQFAIESAAFALSTPAHRLLAIGSCGTVGDFQINWLDKDKQMPIITAVIINVFIRFIVWNYSKQQLSI
jgi:hypothetical protein